MSFIPEENEHAAWVVLSLDEYETIRLMDYEKLTQSECAQKMQVSRTTVTAIYERARGKIADCLVNGKHLVIAGGEVRIDSPKSPEIFPIEKGRNTMRVAVTYDNGEVFQHFGRTEAFKIYDIADGKVTEAGILRSGELGHGALAGLLSQADVDALICGGIGPGAQMALMQEGIQLYAGVSGSADEAAAALAAGTLLADNDATCDHHGGKHPCGHGEDHECCRH